MKRSKAKDVEQALGSGSGNEYADARTALAIEQAKRMEQLRLRDEGKLIPAEQVDIHGAGQRLRSPTSRTAYSRSILYVDPAVYEARAAGQRVRQVCGSITVHALQRSVCRAARRDSFSAASTCSEALRRPIRTTR
jgi:hypothetical protein